MKTYEVTVRMTLVDMENGAGHDVYDRAFMAQWHSDLYRGITNAVDEVAASSTIAVSNVSVNAELLK